MRAILFRISIVLAALATALVGCAQSAVYAPVEAHTRPGRLSAAAKTLAVAIADLDNDGNLDVAAGAGEPGAIIISFGDGAGSLAETQTLAVEGDVRSVALADVNADGLADLIYSVQRGSSGIRIMLNQGGRGWKPGKGPIEINSYEGIRAADVNGDGIPDNYFEASQGSNLEAKILEAITAMLQRAASGTAVSLLSTSAEGEGSLFQAFFKPRFFDNMRLIKWVGYLNALWVDPYGNMREDSDHDNAMVYDKDIIIKFNIDSVTGDTAIMRYRDSDGDGRADVTAPATEPVPFETAPMEEIEPQWEAGKILAQRDASTRTIKTWIDPNGNGEVDAGEVIDFTAANADKLRPFLDVDTVEEAEDLPRVGLGVGQDLLAGQLQPPIRHVSPHLRCLRPPMRSRRPAGPPSPRCRW